MTPPAATDVDGDPANPVDRGHGEEENPPQRSIGVSVTDGVSPIR